MMNVLAKRFDDLKAGRPVQLFKSHRDGIADGDQRRDFIYVDDVDRVIMWLLASPQVSGIFNVGTGKARSFRELMLAGYAALGQAPRSNTSTCPMRSAAATSISPKRRRRLRAAGYNGGFTPLEDAVKSYVVRLSRSRRPVPLIQKIMRKMFDFDALQKPSRSRPCCASAI